MRERAIHYTRANRDARRAGRKSMTRRVVSARVLERFQSFEDTPLSLDDFRVVWDMYAREADERLSRDAQELKRKLLALCPYGAPGDVLYVSEPIEWLDIHYPEGHLRYLDDGADAWVHIPERVKMPELGRWKGRTIPPEWARARDRITDERLERVQDITEADAIAEGVVWRDCDDFEAVTLEFDENGHFPERTGKPAVQSLTSGPARIAFKRLWNAINARRSRSWHKNDMVWVLSFEEMKP